MNEEIVFGPAAIARMNEWEEDIVQTAREIFGDLTCSCCGSEADRSDAAEMVERAFAIHPYHPNFRHIPICHDCTAIIANGFSFRMGGGEYLTPGEHGFPVPAYTRSPKRKTMSHARRMRIFERDKFTCQREGCGSQSDLTIDHIKALSRGGSDDDDNLRTLCRTCNCKKGAREE